jgi:hypothetical protein
MGLFRRSKDHHTDADPLEAAIEAKERGHDGVLGPQVSSAAPILNADPSESDIVEEEMLSSADPEDDMTRELLIERERNQQDPDY